MIRVSNTGVVEVINGSRNDIVNLFGKPVRAQAFKLNSGEPADITIPVGKTADFMKPYGEVIVEDLKKAGMGYFIMPARQGSGLDCTHESAPGVFAIATR